MEQKSILTSQLGCLPTVVFSLAQARLHNSTHTFPNHFDSRYLLCASNGVA